MSNSPPPEEPKNLFGRKGTPEGRFNPGANRSEPEAEEHSDAVVPTNSEEQTVDPEKIQQFVQEQLATLQQQVNTALRGGDWLSSTTLNALLENFYEPILSPPQPLNQDRTQVLNVAMEQLRQANLQTPLTLTVDTFPLKFFQRVREGLMITWARELQKGSEVGKYQIEGTLGSGSYSHIFLAREKSNPNEQVVIKVPVTSEAIGASEREVVLLQQLQRSRVAPPNYKETHIVQLVDPNRKYALGSWLPNLIFRYTSVIDFDKVVNSPEMKNPSAAVLKKLWVVFRHIATALAYLHQNNLVHNDVKPSNILVHGLDKEEGDVYAFLTDFNSATKESFTQPEFTRTYASPHQILARRASSGSDLFSLGASIAESVGLVQEYRALSMTELDAAFIKFTTMVNVVNYPELVKKYPAGLLFFIYRLTSVDPKLQFSSADEVVQFLDTYEHLLTTPASAQHSRKELALMEDVQAFLQESPREHIVREIRSAWQLCRLHMGNQLPILNANASGERRRGEGAAWQELRDPSTFTYPLTIALRLDGVILATEGSGTSVFQTLPPGEFLAVGEVVESANNTPAFVMSAEFYRHVSREGYTPDVYARLCQHWIVSLMKALQYDIE